MVNPIKMRFLGEDTIVNGMSIVKGGIYRVVRGVKVAGYSDMPSIGVYLHDGRREVLTGIPYASEAVPDKYWREEK